MKTTQERMEQERKNKVIKPVQVYKCSITERYTEEEIHK